MTHVAALYDIHGNLPALEAVIDDVRRAGVDRIVVGGDVLPGPMPSESLAYLFGLEVPTQFIRGNGDREVLARKAGIETGTVPERFKPVMQWVADQLQPEQERVMSRWPATLDLAIPGLGDVLFCHASPRNDTEIFTRLTPEDRVRSVLAGVHASLVVCGHTHMQFDRMVDTTRVVNAGSVGMPFGEPAAYWLLLGPGVELRRTAYDLEGAAARIRATAYPLAEEFAARDVLSPPSEQEILERYARVELI